MGDNNAVARAKREAIPWWDEVAQRQIRRGNYVRGFGAWAMKQLAKAGPESWGGLALDVASLGSGAAISAAIKGARAARFAMMGEKFIERGIEAGEIIKTGAGRARVITRTAGSAIPVMAPEPTGAAFKLAQRGLMPNVDRLPKFIEVAASKWADPRSKLGFGRRAAKLASLLYRSIATERHQAASTAVSSTKGTRAGALAGAGAAPPNPVPASSMKTGGSSKTNTKVAMKPHRITVGAQSTSIWSRVLRRPTLGQFQLNPPRIGATPMNQPIRPLRLTLPKLGTSLAARRPSLGTPQLHLSTFKMPAAPKLAISGITPKATLSPVKHSLPPRPKTPPPNRPHLPVRHFRPPTFRR